MLTLFTIFVILQAACGQINPGWQYTGEKADTRQILTSIVEPDQLSFPSNGFQTSSMQNPLSIKNAIPKVIGTTKFTGKFEPGSTVPDRALNTSFDPSKQFNFLQVDRSGVITEFTFPNTADLVNIVDKWVSQFQQPDTMTYDLAGDAMIGTMPDPGAAYTCTTTATGKQCAKNPTNPNKVATKGKRYIFGADDRVFVNGARAAYPFRVVGLLGNHCTATLIAPRVVLTAGHCVFSQGGPGVGDWIADLSFKPAHDSGLVPQDPYGTLDWVSATTVTGWTVSNSWNWDFAIVKLASEPNIGWMSFGWHSGIDNGWGMNLNGYGGDVWSRMQHSFGTLVGAASDTFSYRNSLDMVKGHSGSGVYLYQANNNFRRIYGVNSCQVWVGGDPMAANANFNPGHQSPSWNQACRITSSKFARICGWIADPRIGC